MLNSGCQWSHWVKLFSLGIIGSSTVNEIIYLGPWYMTAPVFHFSLSLEFMPVCISVCVCVQVWLRSAHQSLFWGRTCSQLHLSPATLRTRWSLCVSVCFTAATPSGYPPSLWEPDTHTHTHTSASPSSHLKTVISLSHALATKHLRKIYLTIAPLPLSEK